MAEPAAGEELTLLRATQGMPPLVAAQKRDRGIGPFGRLVLRGANVIDGTGAPPIGPIDVVVEKGHIVEMRKVGYAGAPIHPERRPAKGDHEIDCHGKWVAPGFIDCHAHAGVAYHAVHGWVPPVGPFLEHSGSVHLSRAETQPWRLLNCGILVIERATHCRYYLR